MSRHSRMSAAHSHCFAFDGTVLERVLLAIIEAHTTPETDGRQHERLSAAMTALTDYASSEGQDKALRDALAWMARERQRDACARDMLALQTGSADIRPVRSVRTLATMAANQFLDRAIYTNQCHAADVLQRKFVEQRGAGSRNGSEPDPVREAMEAEAVERICAELAEWDVPTRL